MGRSWKSWCVPSTIWRRELVIDLNQLSSQISKRPLHRLFSNIFVTTTKGSSRYTTRYDYCENSFWDMSHSTPFRRFWNSRPDGDMDLFHLFGISVPVLFTITSVTRTLVKNLVFRFTIEIRVYYLFQIKVIFTVGYTWDDSDGTTSQNRPWGVVSEQRSPDPCGTEEVRGGRCPRIGPPRSLVSTSGSWWKVPFSCVGSSRLDSKPGDF